MSDFQLDPQARAVLERAAQATRPRLSSLPPGQARQQYRETRRPTQPTPPAVQRLRDLCLPGAGQGLAVREYRPLGTRDDELLPALVFFHGGGWVLGDLETHDVLCRQLCNQSRCAVFAVDYRLAPEHAFPAAVDDAVLATRWIAQHAAELGLDDKRLAVGGDSAGGNLAAVVALTLRGDAAITLAAQLLIYPVTDLRAQTNSYRSCGTGYALTADEMAWFGGHYLQNGDAADWRVSPLLASDHAGLPPALIVTAGYDPLHDEGRLYADRLAAAGTAVQYVCFARQMHAFIGMGGVIEESNTAVRLCADWLQERLAG